MSERAIAGIVSLCFVLTGLFLANMFLMMMIGEINRKRDEGNLISYFGFTFPKMLRIFGEYGVHTPGESCTFMRLVRLHSLCLALLALVCASVSWLDVVNNGETAQ